MVSLAYSGPDSPEQVEWPASQRPELREFLTAYARHLPLARRPPWRVLEEVTRLASKTTLAHIEGRYNEG
jgi:hypothetical protein